MFKRHSGLGQASLFLIYCNRSTARLTAIVNIFRMKNDLVRESRFDHPVFFKCIIIKELLYNMRDIFGKRPSAFSRRPVLSGYKV